MARRTKRTQSKHDQTVRRVAGGFVGKDWKVSADVKGYPKPRKIFGRRPDVIARKGARTRVIEVETPRTFAKDVGQRKAFRRWTSQSSKRRFRTKITK